ncbi:DUF6551 family protein [Methylosinus sp. Sm6]|uniref:DUF6551 family protein n=1 Tax=Methylosinus sp. Sm6 TaxID=2866948 RepID=UPI001C99FC1A|nr:DUF6551 family protein [Methylosinus sp. Sm6]MBY6242822.1 hypothetical protein [Methylosinus sp. Sm6]
MSVPGIEPAQIDAARPEFRDVDPRTLLVDESYQRNLAEKSVTLIRKIVGGWSWRAFKPPICVEIGDALHVIDGQHTAIAAASHPEIDCIPVMIVPAGKVEDRALAFVRHNRDRIHVTPNQLHYALLAAGDETAQTIREVCERAGARVLKAPPSQGRYKPGDVMAVGSLSGLVSRRHALGARRVLEICVKGQLAPISAAALKAVEELLFGESYAGAREPEDIAMTIRAMGPGAEREAAKFCAEHDLPLWKGLVVTWFRATRKPRNGR